MRTQEEVHALQRTLSCMHDEEGVVHFHRCDFVEGVGMSMRQELCERCRSCEECPSLTLKTECKHCYLALDDFLLVQWWGSHTWWFDPPALMSLETAFFKKWSWVSPCRGGIKYSEEKPFPLVPHLGIEWWYTTARDRKSTRLNSSHL